MKAYRKIYEEIPNILFFEKVSKEESKTTPNQAISVREVLHRYTKGEVLTIANGVPVYGENQILYDVRRKNNIDIAEDSLANQENIQKLDNELVNNVLAERSHRALKFKSNEQNQESSTTPTEA